MFDSKLISEGLLPLSQMSSDYWSNILLLHRISMSADTIRDCWVHLINNGITIRGNSVTVEWQGTGAGESTTFTCQLDNRSLETCEC